jgi:hypothetical protein
MFRKTWTVRGLVYSARGRFFKIMLYVRHVHLTKGQTSIRDQPVLSSERILHKDNDSKRSVVLKKRTPVMVLKRLDAKTAGLAVNRQS